MDSPNNPHREAFRTACRADWAGTARQTGRSMLCSASSVPAWQSLTGNQVTKGKYSLPSRDSEAQSRARKGSGVTT